MGTETFVGRIREVGVLASVVERASGGDAGAVLVSGDPGVGKTELLRQVTDPFSDSSIVLTVACLPLSSTTVPFLALRLASRDLTSAERPPIMVESASREPLPIAPVLFDDWLTAQCLRQPVVLFVDDLQWADLSTLDVLMYALAGPAERRLAILLTLRRGELREGHPLHRWLADVRRMPNFAEVELAAFDVADTRAQLELLLGAPPHDSLVRETYAKTRGNAYLNRLLVQGLTPTARHVPSDFADDLASAVLRDWHQMSPEARAFAQVIAVNGHIGTELSLTRAAEVGRIADPGPLLHEALDHGLLEVDQHGAYWFRHPLQAEVLAASLTKSESRRLHAAFAASYEGDVGLSNSADPDVPAAMANHYAQCGDPESEYTWTLRAADAAKHVGGGNEELKLLNRAVELRRDLPGSAPTTVDLWQRLRLTAERLGAHEDELAAVENLLLETDSSVEPLLVAELLIRRTHLQFSTGRAFFTTDGPQRAMELTRGHTASWQHAMALAELGHSGLWVGDPDAPAHIRRAVRLASDIGDPKASAYALTAAAMLAVFENRSDEGLELSSRAVRAAVDAHDWWAYVHAAVWEAFSCDNPVSPKWCQQLGPRRQFLEDRGVAQAHVALLSSLEAASLLHSGDWKRTADRLRVALGSTPGAVVDINTRLVAARLAALQGRQAEADAHLARAEELSCDISTFRVFPFDAVRATVFLAAADPARALEAAWAGASTEGTPVDMCEWLIPLAARALADQAQTDRDAGRSSNRTLERLDALVAAFPQVISDRVRKTPFYLKELNALNAWYAAEVARARQAPEAPDAWTAAVERLDGVLPWEHAYAAWRASEALLVAGRRDEASSMLRAALERAETLRSTPVIAELHELAQTARIPIGKPSSPGLATASGVLAGLTARELDILAFIVAGRTYREISRALFISEKTVSSHVSNMLRKTGSTNRIDLARRATRGGARASD